MLIGVYFLFEVPESEQSETIVDSINGEETERLEVTLSTDKTLYLRGEPVNITLEVTGENSTHLLAYGYYLGQYREYRFYRQEGSEWLLEFDLMGYYRSSSIKVCDNGTVSTIFINYLHISLGSLGINNSQHIWDQKHPVDLTRTCGEGEYISRVWWYVDPGNYKAEFCYYVSDDDQIDDTDTETCISTEFEISEELHDSIWEICNSMEMSCDFDNDYQFIFVGDAGCIERDA